MERNNFWTPHTFLWRWLVEKGYIWLKITLGSETASHSFWAFSHPHRQVIPDYQKLEVLVAVARRSMANIIVQKNYGK